jgi:putative oxidoreductase
MMCGIVTAHPPMEGQEVDWKRLVQFALLGSSCLEQYAILLVRLSLGLFFAISGANKLFVAAARKLCTKRSLRPKSRFPT